MKTSIKQACGVPQPPTAVKPNKDRTTHTKQTPIKLLAVAILTLSFVSTGFSADDKEMMKEGDMMGLDGEMVKHDSKRQSH